MRRIPRGTRRRGTVSMFAPPLKRFPHAFAVSRRTVFPRHCGHSAHFPRLSQKRSAFFDRFLIPSDHVLFGWGHDTPYWGRKAPDRAASAYSLLIYYAFISIIEDCTCFLNRLLTLRKRKGVALNETVSSCTVTGNSPKIRPPSAVRAFG